MPNIQFYNFFQKKSMKDEFQDLQMVLVLELADFKT